MSEESRTVDVGRHPPWTEMRSFVDADTPSVHVIDGDPKLTFTLPGRGEAMNLLVPLGGDPPSLPPLEEISVDRVDTPDGPHLRLHTASTPLFPLFYEFALLVADRTQSGVLAGQAVQEAFSRWRRLIQAASMLSTERQTGLYGELLLLRRLERTLGAAALDAWTGPSKAAHDFRLGDFELEAKATRGERRVHTINGLAQLEPSPGCRLFVVSIQLTAAGAGGESLADLISGLRDRFTERGVGDEFSQSIEVSGISTGLERHYRESLKKRTHMALVEVDENLPRITVADVAAIGRPEMSRISDVRFRLDLTGLGSVDGSDEFRAVIPEDHE